MDITDEDKIKKVVQDGETVERHNPKDLIALDQYENSKTASQQGNAGIKFFAMKPGGTV